LNLVLQLFGYLFSAAPKVFVVLVVQLSELLHYVVEVRVFNRAIDFAAATHTLTSEAA